MNTIMFARQATFQPVQFSKNTLVQQPVAPIANEDQFNRLVLDDDYLRRIELEMQAIAEVNEHELLTLRGLEKVEDATSKRALARIKSNRDELLMLEKVKKEYEAFLHSMD